VSAGILSAVGYSYANAMLPAAMFGNQNISLNCSDPGNENKILKHFAPDENI